MPIEGGPHATGDRHVIVVDRDTCTDYELFAAYPHNGGYVDAGSGAIFNLGSDHLRPAGWTSADAAGLPILPGLARYDEVADGAIDHALRFTAPVHGPRTSIRPATTPPPAAARTPRRWACACGSRRASTSPACPARRGSSPQALKRYGMILADNGSPWYISGAPEPRWNDDALHQLDRLSGGDFEVVDTSSLPHPGAEPGPGVTSRRAGAARPSVRRRS